MLCVVVLNVCCIVLSFQAKKNSENEKVQNFYLTEKRHPRN